MRIYLSFHSKSKTDLDETLRKNFKNRLVELAQELAQLVIETNIKLHEPKIFDERINNPIYEKR